MNKNIIIAIVVILVLAGGIFIYLSGEPASNGNGGNGGNGGPPEVPRDDTTVSELLASPVYGSPVKIVGEAQLIGELLCACFEISSGGESITVWYDTMVEEGGAVRPAVSIDGIENGDTLVVVGELRQPEADAAPSEFWASSITKVEAE